MAARKIKSPMKAPEQVAKLQAVVGHVVAARRGELKLAQGELARRLGVTPGTASKIEAGQAVSVDQLWMLAKALELSPSELVKRIEDAVTVLRHNGVKVSVRRVPEEQASDDAQVLTAAALAGVIGFLAGRDGRR